MTENAIPLSFLQLEETGNHPITNEKSIPDSQSMDEFQDDFYKKISRQNWLKDTGTGQNLKHVS